MSGSKIGTLRVPGARLYYTVRGAGPVLLLLQGGGGDADGMAALAEHLAEHYTVVSYDRRGLSRSTLDDPTGAPTLQTHGDDAHRLLAALTSEPAFVFGGSLGALLGLELVARHPNQVRILVAHEPPLLQLLPAREHAAVERSQAAVEATRRQEGALAAVRQGMALLGIDFDDREPDVVLPPPSPQRAANLAFHTRYDAPAAHRYRPDLAALRAATARIVPAGGRTSRESWPYRAAGVLADRLGTAVIQFPGGHNGYILQPRAFAAALREVLGGSRDGHLQEH